MTTLPDRFAQLSPLKRALLAIDELQARVAAAEHAAREPLAIIGMGCRFPGAASPAAFWELLREGRSAITEVPADRWDVDALYDPDPDAAGKTIMRAGGFLDAIDRFDAEFFSIAPREAATMDPQQRLLLEVTWEALEHAGVAPDQLSGSPTGVFLGIISGDYATLLGERDPSSIEAHDASGNAHSIASGRLAYLLGLHGPAISVDTACSSSLVAMHLACQSLRLRECRMAIVGGVNLVITPDSSVIFSKARMLAADGRCKTFDASADGFVRGEGCGVIVVKRLADARADGDRVLAIVRGSAVNQDGPSSGLTAPHGPAQEALMRAALANGEVDPRDVSYVEAHGTGTVLGDPIEVQALGAVFADHSPGDPLRIGSVKTNVGHLEAAAGIAGVMKVVLAMQHGEIPAHLNFAQPNPHVEWDALPVVVQTARTPWPAERRPIAGVSSFGFSGTNAHVVVEAAPPAESEPVVPTAPAWYLLPISARTSTALDRRLRDLDEWLGPGKDTSLADICHTLAEGRAHHAWRVACVARTTDEFRAQLGALIQGHGPSGTVRGRTPSDPRRHADPANTQAVPAAPSPADQADSYQRLMAAATTYVRGGAVDWPRLHADQRPRKIDLPTYPFERERHWIPATKAGHRPRLDRRPTGADGELLGIRLQSPALSAAVWESTITQVDAPHLYDHRAGDTAIMPAVGFIEMACAAGQEYFGSTSCQLADLVIQEALVLPERGARVLQTVLTPDGGHTMLQIFSAQDDSTRAWTQHVRGTVRPSSADSWPADDDALALARRRCVAVLPVEKFYEALRTRGLRFGPAFLGVRGLWVGPGEALGRIVQPEIVVPDPARVAYPPLFDACLQVMAALAMSPDIDESALYLPFAIDSCAIRGPLPPTLWSAVRLRDGDDHAADLRVADLRVFDDDGALVARIDGLRMRKASHVGLGSRVATPTPNAVEDLQYEVQWRPVDIEARASDPLTDLLQPLQARAREWAAEPSVRQHHQLLTRLDAISVAIIADTLRALGVGLQAGEVLSHQTADVLRIAPQQRRLWHRLLDILAEDGVLARLPADGDNPSGWRVVRTLPLATASPELAAFTTGPTAPEVTIVQRSASALAGVLTGIADPLAVLFPDGSADLVDALYRQTPTAKLYQRLAGEAVARIVAGGRSGTQASRQPIRVLEVGGGTASMTEAVIDALPAGGFRYTFTDISPLLVARAAQRFSDRHDIACSVLDLERDPAEQHLGPASFDLIVASNVVHATRDLAETLGHLRGLLDPEGALVLLEVTTPQRWVDLSFGMTDGWWRFTDTHLRPSHPLLPASAWITFLRHTGFKDVVSVPDIADDQLLALQALIVARPSPAGAARRTVGIVGDTSGVGIALRDLLVSRGATVRFLAPADGSLAIPDGCDELIDLRAIDPVSDDSAVAQQSLVAPLLALSQALASVASPPQLTLITRGAQAIGPEADAPPGTGVEQSTVWGFARSLAHEHPALRARCIDLDPSVDSPTQDAEAITRVMFADTLETEIAWRGTQAWTPRLARQRLAHEQPITALRLVATDVGRIDSLTMAPADRRAPADHEVEIQVSATALNFRDVANVLGLRQDSDLLGSECSGTVCTVGADVTGFAVGDEVVALAPGACASFATTSAALVVPKPKDMSFEEAAGVPIAWLTADYALNRVGRLQPGERVLIHAAAGGVGLAAVRLAQQRRAEIFATAGSERKRAWLRAQGVLHVMDSRSHGFVLEVADRTGGAGVHLALNSLAGPFIPSTLSTLARGGRFLEIGKNNIWTTVAMEAARPDVAYTPIDLSPEMAAGAPWIAPRMRELLDELHAGSLAPLPRRVFGFSRAREAFRCMVQARHIGKVVLRSLPADTDRGTFRANPRGTYAVTGGCAGLGLVVAEWLAERGAQTLVLIGRSVPDPAAEARIARLREQGLTVVIHQGDVSNPDHMAHLEVRLRDLPPLRGVIHAAGILDDGVVAQQSWSRFASVFAPKIVGARQVERLVDGRPLDFFILFSSAAALTGPPGQSNHAAANAWLDAFAHARTADGLPTSSINWGAWAETGAAMRPGVRERVERQGGRLITPSLGLAALERVLLDPRPQTAVLSIDWARQDAPRQNTHDRMFDELAAPPPPARVASPATASAPAKTTPRPAKDPALLARLQGAPADRRLRVIGDYLHEQARRVLGLPGARVIDPHQPLTDLGLDSLMAVEFRNLLATAASLALSSTLLFEHPTLDALTRFLAVQLGVEDARSTAPVSSPSPVPADSPVGAADVFDRVEQLSDEEIDRIFAMHVEAAEPLADD